MIGQKSQEQGNDRQGPFAAGEKRQGLLLLSWRADIDFHTGFQDMFLVGQGQVGRTAAEETAEDILEVDADFLEGLGELFGHGRIDFSDDSPQFFPRFFQVIALAVVEVPLFQSRLVFVFSCRVDGPQGCDLPFREATLSWSSFSEPSRRRSMASWRLRPCMASRSS